MENETKNKKFDLVKKMEELADSVITDPEKLKAFVDGWSKGFHTYSFCNYLLIWCQKRDATLCAGFNQWKKLHDRHVKAGEKGIAILAPIIYKRANPDNIIEAITEDKEIKEVDEYVIDYKVVYVFDVSQTEGKPLNIGHTDKVKGNVSFEEIKSKLGYVVEMQNESQDNGHTDGEKIVIRKKENEASMIATLLHEAAHIELGHTDRASNDKVSRDIQEIEAESVSYIVCSYLGIENERAKGYIGYWSRGQGEKVKNQGMRILKISEKLIKKIN